MSNIPRPFDTAEKADLVIETCDGAHLYVLKLFLVYASPFFAHLFADSVPDEKYNDIPLYRVPETSRTMVTLLHLCYPAYLVKTDIIDEHIDAALMEALEKYVMEGVFEHLKEIMEDAEMVKKNPLKIYAIARHLRWDDLTKRAAREALKFGILTAEPIPELKLISAHDYQLLMRYFAACSTAVTRFLTPTLSANKENPLLTRNSIPELIACFVFGCSVYQYGAYGLRCGHNGCSIEEGGLITRQRGPEKLMHAWFTDYMHEIFEDVALRPGNGVINPSALDRSLIKAETQCPTQKPTAVRAALEWINTEVEYIIEQITLEL